MIRLFPIGIPVVLVLGSMYEVEIHMLLILSPIVLAGGLIDDALTTHVIYYNGVLSRCQGIICYFDPYTVYFISKGNIYITLSFAK